MKKTLFKKINQTLINIVFPIKCSLCGQIIEGSSTVLCQDCLKEVFKTYPKNNNENILVLYEYTERMKAFIGAIKYLKKRNLLELAGKKIVEVISFYQQPDLIIPVPLNPLRERERGFNQALEIIKKFAQFHKITIVNNLILRKHNTQRSYLLDKKARLAQAQTAFDIWPEKALLINGKHVLLFDDIITTGSTTNAIKQLLYQYGAKKVTLFSLAGVP